jgi:hypothetical protein
MILAGIIRSLRRLTDRGAQLLGRSTARKSNSPSGNHSHRVEALEKAAEVQAAFNETVTFQLKVVCDLLEQSRKRLFAMTLWLIATATVAAVALAAAMLS